MEILAICMITVVCSGLLLGLGAEILTDYVLVEYVNNHVYGMSATQERECYIPLKLADEGSMTASGIILLNPLLEDIEACTLASLTALNVQQPQQDSPFYDWINNPSKPTNVVTPDEILELPKDMTLKDIFGYEQEEELDFEIIVQHS